MYYRIEQTETLEGSDLTYTRVRFWANRLDFIRDNPHVTDEDFISDIRLTAERIVINEDGWYVLKDGNLLNPEDMDPAQNYEFRKETVALDPSERIIENIERFIENNLTALRGGTFPRDRTSKRVRLRPVAERSDVTRDSRVTALVGTARESRVSRR